MATKVGAFKKDGTVQCVKLVEEDGTPNLEGFNGTYDNTALTFNNGIKLTWIGLNGGYGWSTVTRLSCIASRRDTFNTSTFFVLSFSGGKVTASFDSSDTDHYAYMAQEDIGMLGFYVTVPSAVSYYFSSGRLAVSYNSQSYTYATNAGSASSPLYYYNTDWTFQFKVPREIRVKPPTVRMGKDGTLRCSKLIEEPIINLIDDYSGTAASPYDKYDKLVLNNGITLAVTKDGAPSENFFRTLFLQFSSAASTISRLFSINIMNSNVVSVTAGTAPDGSVPWEFKQDYPIDGYITVSTPGVYAAGQYVLTISDSTQSVNYSVTLDSSSAAFSFSPSTSGDYFILSYDMRMKVPTVRIGKDGTIRCAKVQEATLTPKIGNGDWFEMTRSSASSGTFNFYGGQWTMTVEGPNGGSPTLFQTVSTIYAQFPLLPSGQPDNTIQWVGPPPYTTYYPSIYDESNYNRDGTININRIVVISSASMEGYKITINNGQNTAVYEWHLFTGTSNAFEPVGEQQWELTESDRFTYSWD